MQTNLTLSHLLPYLDGGLYVQVHSVDGFDIEPLTAIQIKDGFEIAQISNTDYYFNEDNDFSIKPILKPLSDYADVVGTAMNELNIDISDQCIISDLANKKIGYWIVPFGVIQIMAADKIDFQNLIVQGLAVDENTLTEKVY